MRLSLAIIIIIVILGYLAVTSRLGEQSPLQLPVEPEHVKIVHKGYSEKYGNSAEDMEREDMKELEKALDMIKKHSPQGYEMVNEYVDVIELVPASLEMHNNRCFPSQKKIQLITGSKYCRMYCNTPVGYDLTRASTIVHEACHIMRYHAGEESALEYEEYFMEEEEACQKMQNDFMEKVARELGFEDGP